MVNIIREKILKSRAYKIVLWIVILAIGGVFSLVELVKFIGPNRNWVIKVNNERVYKEEFVGKVSYQQQLVQAIKQQYGQYADLYMQMMGMGRDPLQLAFDQAVQEALLNQAARKLDSAISPEYAMKKLADPSFLYRHGDLVPPQVMDPSGTLNKKALNTYLKQMNLSISDLQQQVIKAIKRDLLIDLVGIGSYAPEFGIKDQFHMLYAGKKFSIATLDFSSILEKEKKNPIDKAELESFFTAKNTQNKQYFVPEKRSGRVWRFDPGQYGIAVTPAEIEAYYDAHKTKKYVQQPVQIQIRRILFKVPDKENAQSVYDKAQAIRQELVQDPSLFEQRAMELSEDVGSPKGGLLPPFARGTHDRELEKAAFILSHDNEISPVITTKDGVEIIQRVNKKPQVFKPLATVEQEIKDILIQQRFNKRFVQDMTTHITQFKQDPAVATQFFTQKKAKSEVLDKVNSDSSRAAQELFKLSKGNYGAYLDGDVGVLVQLTDIQDGYMPALDSIASAVEQDLYEERAAKTVKELVSRAYAQVTEDRGSFENLKDKYGFSIEKTDFITQKESDLLQKMNSRGLPVVLMMRLEKVGSLLGYGQNHDGFLIRLDEVQPFNQDVFDQERATINQQATQRALREVIAGFVASLYRNATIKTNQSLINIQE